jgi:hypothetical protein
VSTEVDGRSANVNPQDVDVMRASLREDYLESPIGDFEVGLVHSKIFFARSRLTSVRFKGTFSVEREDTFNTPSEVRRLVRRGRIIA